MEVPQLTTRRIPEKGTIKQGYLLVNVVGELVVASESHQSAKSETIREENLSDGIDPNLKNKRYEECDRNKIT